MVPKQKSIKSDWQIKRDDITKKRQKSKSKSTIGVF